MDQQPLVCPAHSTQYLTMLLVGVFVGVGLSSIYVKQTSADTYQAGFAAAKKLAEESPVGGMFRIPDDVRRLSGTVTAINGDRIAIHTQSQNPFFDPALVDRVVIVTSNTKITKISSGDTAAFQAALDTYLKNRQTGKKTTGTPPIPPEPVVTTIGVSGIQVGDTLTAITTENISAVKEFTASEIQVK